jgi:hypothetical protein
MEYQMEWWKCLCFISFICCDILLIFIIILVLILVFCLWLNYICSWWRYLDYYWPVFDFSFVFDWIYMWLHLCFRFCGKISLFFKKKDNKIRKKIWRFFFLLRLSLIYRVTIRNCFIFKGDWLPRKIYWFRGRLERIHCYFIFLFFFLCK